MLKAENIIIRTINHKPEQFDKICGFVRFLAWDAEYTNTKRTYSKMTSMISEKFPFANLAEIDVKELILVDGLEVQKFIETRKRMRELDGILDELAKQGFTKISYDALNSTDKVFLTLQAHTSVKGIQIDESVLTKSNGEKLDFEPLINKWIANGQKFADIRKALSAVFSKMVNSEGDLFYPIKIKKGDLPESDVRHFLGAFLGKTGRSDKGKGRYQYLTDISDKKVLSAVTDLYAVILESDCIEVIKPESQDEK